MRFWSRRLRIMFGAALVMSFILPQLSKASPSLQTTNLALGRPASASSVEAAGFEAGLAVDGNAATRWASLEGVDPQWISVDLGAPYALNRVRLTWEAAFARAYRVEVSVNGSTWTQSYATTTGDGGVDDLALGGTARYVRVYGTQRGTTYGYSLFEFEVYGAPALTPTTGPTATATRTPTPTIVAPPSGNLARGKTTATSSVEAAGLEGAKAVDGNATGTRWASAYSDPQWISVDLGTQYTLTRVRLFWEAAYARAYRIEVSNNGTTWTQVYATTTGDGGTDTIDFGATRQRYVRVYGTQRATAWGYSLWEFEVFGYNDPSPTPTTGPTSTPVPPTPTNTPVPPTPTRTPAPPTPTATPNPGGNTPVGINGQLRVCGTKLCNQYGKPIQLRGMSTHGIQWYGWNKCVTGASLTALANDWKADILRISLYVQEGGYETNPAGFRTQVDTIVNETASRGMYTLIDWHMLNPGDPMFNLDRAKEYFAYMAQRHGSKPNTIYEIANEPNNDGNPAGVTVNWARIKSYAEQIIPVIRQHDPDGIIIVGTPDWSSFGLSGSTGPEEVINNQIASSNIMYSFHFYAASHTAYHRDGLARAADRIPVFVTEWGSQEYTGDGPNDFASAQAYIDLMAQKQISWTSWNYSDDPRTGAAFNPGTCSAGGPWSGSSLKEAGSWVRG
ncbi:MAG TPA: cellulase family glycosylhydrolase, partial [Herpetosiphonaceae bacterium]